MLDVPRLGQSGCDVHDGGQGVDSRGAANARNVVHAVLKTDDGRAGSEMRCEGARGVFSAESLHAEKDEIRVAGGGDFGGGSDGYTLLERDRIEEKPAAADCFHVWGAGNESDIHTGSRQHSAEVRTDRACSDDGYPGACIRGILLG